MKIAIMQPYIFPYIGYFQLIHATDTFVFYDDVNYINRGWINRNRILLNEKDHLFTIPVAKASQNKTIHSIETAIDEKTKKNFSTTLYQAYKKAPFYSAVAPLITDIINTSHQNVASLATESVQQICRYIGLNREFKISSVSFPESRDMKKADRLIDICKASKINDYINAYGGTELYNKEYFKEQNIKLFFLKSKEIRYDQGISGFVPWLSIIDVLMFNSPKDTLALANEYELI